MPATRISSHHTIQSFGELSRFLREGVADEESRELRDSLGQLSQAIDEALRVRRSGQAVDAVLSSVRSLQEALKTHQRALTGLGSAWHALYEMGAYQNALRELCVSVDEWLAALLRRSSREGRYFDHFELLAWRTLGEALLLIDMYEHSGDAPSDLMDLSRPMPARTLLAKARSWFFRWRGRAR